jgi:hypothetical protein
MGFMRCRLSRLAAATVMVVHAIAEGDDPHVRTRFRWSKSVAAASRGALKALAIIDLAGARRAGPEVRREHDRP